MRDRIVLYPQLLHPYGVAPKQPFNRIVGGEEATPHEYPFIVALHIDGRYFCGGSILSENVVVTAAHCLDDADSVKIIAGAHMWREDEDTQQVRISTDFTVHEDWSTATLNNDIAIARFEEPFDFSGKSNRLQCLFNGK